MITNTVGIEAEEVALFYKKRWTIELPFKKIKQPFYIRNNLESFVRYGIGTYAYPYLWKANKSAADYQEAWGDSRDLKV